MYSDLFRYLIRYNELPLPGVGTFSIERRSAQLDFPAKRIHPPKYFIRFRETSFLPNEHFFSWLAHVRNVSDREAVFRFNDFAIEMKRNLEEGNRIVWSGVGELSKDESGEIHFIAVPVLMEEELRAEKVIRADSGHFVRVGEDQKTSEEMTGLLARKEKTALSWWIPALAVMILALMFIGWYLSENGLEIFSISNSKKIVPGEAAGINYRLLP